MNEDTWARVKTHFEALSQLPPDQRAAGLAAVPDDEVRRDVASLLDHSADGDGFGGIIESLIATLESDDATERLGPWRVVRRLGHGGQGTVFAAARDDGRFEQRAALKIVKWEIDSEMARRRFREERQLLARLEHPGIARLLDGGETSSGSPYLVMELVDGLPLIDATQGWNTIRKLDLFLKVLAAVAFAHRNLIVHRDLKPANILVTREGEPKLLDFGIARLINAESAQTATALQALTPQYASPEQVRGGVITTAADIYALGVVLYELLAGRRPYELDTSSPLTIERVICETPPEPPGISGDLDNILLMALRKEPERRYSSAEQFAEDIQRSLESRPVIARPDTLRYRSARFIRRNRLSLGAVAAVMIALAGGVVASQYEARRAERRFQDVRQLANAFIFGASTRLQGGAGPTAAREEMVRTAVTYIDKLAAETSDVALQGELTAAWQTVGDVQMESLGSIDDARRSYLKAVALGERLLVRQRTPAVVKAVAASYLGLADLGPIKGDPREAIAYGDKAVRLAESLVADAAWRRDFLMVAYTKVGAEYLDSGRPVEALALSEKGLRLSGAERGAPTQDDRLRLAGLALLKARALKNRGDLIGASAEWRRGYDNYCPQGCDADHVNPDLIVDLMGPVGGPGAGPLELFARLADPAIHRQAHALALAAAARDPGRRSLRTLMITYWTLAIDTLSRSRPAAYEAFRHAVEIGGRLLVAEPRGASTLGSVSNAEALFGEALSSADLPQALTHLRRALELTDRLPTASVTDRRRAIDALLRLGRAETQGKLFDAAKGHLDRCLQLSLSLWPEARDDLRSYAYIAMSWEAIGDLTRLTAGPRSACLDYRKSLDTWLSWRTAGTSSFYDQEHASVLVAKLAKCGAS